MTWTETKPIDPEDPELPFSETDYKKRRAHYNYKSHINCEREVLKKGLKNKDKLKTYVIASGLVYGAEEEDLFFFFKLAWNNRELPIFKPGKRLVPLIHIKDLAKVVHGLMEKLPKKPHYILAVEQIPSSFKQIIKSLSKIMGSGKSKEVAAEEAFLYSEITQTLYDRYTFNLNMEPTYIVEELAIVWQNESNLVENMANIINEFKKTRNLKPIRIILHGPPAVGKTRVAKQLSEYYGVYYGNIKSIIEDTIQALEETIEKEKAKIQAREKVNADESYIEEEEEDEEDDDEIDIEELEEKIREIENTMAQNENGKLPDDQVIEMVKSFMMSNKCQNRGYILDGFPKTMEETVNLFKGKEDEGEELGEEEEDAEGGDSKNNLLPDYVISLEATDQFLCERVMILPEKEIQNTHYTEEGMLSRLLQFRADNTEDNTMLNFFNEIEIHPLIIDVMNDNTSTMNSVIQEIQNHIGRPIKFAPSPDEEEIIMHLKREQEILLEKQAKIKHDLLQQQAVADHQSKMEEWTQTLEQLQMEEEKILAAEGEPLRHYLMKFVFPTLAKGLLDVARLKPNDPIDFLAEYLFKENPEGHMFDPAYTREGKRILDNFKENLEKDISELSSNNKQQ